MPWWVYDEDRQPRDTGGYLLVLAELERKGVGLLQHERAPGCAGFARAEVPADGEGRGRGAREGARGSGPTPDATAGGRLSCPMYAWTPGH